MGKHKREQFKPTPKLATPKANTIPEPVKEQAVQTAPAVASTEPVAVAPATVAEKPEMTELDIFGILRKQAELIPDETIRAKALASLEKLKADADRSNATKHFAAFNTALETELPKYLAELAKTHGVSLAGRKITIAYPADGTIPKPSHTPIGAKGSGNGNRNGFPTGWGKATLVKDGKETTYDSPSALALAMHLQVQGKRTMVDVFENPTREGTKEALPKTYKVDAVKGDHFRVTVA